MPTRERSDREAYRRAEALLRERLTPAQLADANKTGWFNTRDALGSLWRVCAGTVSAQHFIHQNLTDEQGKGRTMYAAYGEDLPVPDVALAMLLYFSDKERTRYVHEYACRDVPNSCSPRLLADFYDRYGEDVGGGTKKRRRS